MIDDALLDQLLAEAGVVDTDRKLRPRPRDSAAALRLSYAQEVLWLLERSSPGMTAYNVPIARRIAGPLDRTRLQCALDAIVARHEVLRTRFAAVDGEPAPVVDPPGTVEMRFVDVSDLAPAQRDARTDALVVERSQATFDLESDHLFRATLVRRGAEDHVLVFEMHHLVSDGLSVGILERELSALYRSSGKAREAGLPQLELQYADYAAWQRETVAGDALEELLNYWRAELADCGEPLGLPADFPQTGLPSARGVQQSLTLDVAVTRRLQQLARAHGTTTYVAMLAAYATVLHRYTGRSNIVVGSNVAARMEAEVEHVIGYFNNTLPLRADCTGDPSFAELIERVRDTVLGAYDHQNVPLEALVRELQKDDADLGRAPLYNVVLTSQNAMSQPMTLGEATSVAHYGVDLGVTKFDLTLFMAETPAGLRLMLRARADLWSPQTVARFLGHLREIVHDAVRVPNIPLSQLALLSPEERAQLAAWNDTALAGVPPSVVESLESSARRVPARVAVRCGDGSITYRELDDRANQLARHLRSLGVREGSVVGLLLERSIEAVAAIFGILKAGAAYAPLALDQPAARLAAQVRACGARVVVTLAEHTGRLPDSIVVALDRDAASFALQSPARLEVTRAPDALAYVLFTSGSTGTPKPVAITHANIAQYTRSIGRVVFEDGIDGWNVGMLSTLAADLGNTALFPALCAGATLHVIAHDVATDAERFAAYRTRHAIDLVKMTPSHLRALLGAASPGARDALLPERCLLLGGERFPFELADEIDAILAARTANRCNVYNHYGPTETTVGAATFLVDRATREAARAAGASSIPIGKPLANVSLFVCDAAGNELPIGVPGELYVGGAGVAAGYLDRPDFTAQRFGVLANNGRTYRTGDRVRRSSTGDVEFLGRVDEQVKIRGFRVEPGEIEALFEAHPEVARAAVFARAVAGADEPILVAYVVPLEPCEGLPERLQPFAADRLPAHMLPAAILVIDALPLTKNGKLDRRALPDPVFGGAAAARVAPRTALERELTTLWAETFKRDAAELGVTDNFFSLGGQSLLAIRLLGKMSRLLNVRLSLRSLFDHPTIEELAATVAGMRPDETGSQRIGRAAGRGSR
ncbi:MAG: amino acid adenylation domain-containing protein [Candidatus Eremiobacteraeota bacterium]|nr:amino acid adenylation domain-containing protein [Candidatus Eremiobacteraeota bacterium]